jgi:uncharacterized membrane protein YphA (DoxX/SURF4 family)
MKRTDLTWVALRVFVGLVLTFAGFSKLMEPYENFRGMINEYGVVPYAWSAPLAQGLPWLELIFGVFMLAGYMPRLAAAGAAGLSITFLIAMGASDSVMSSWTKDCGCFGQGGLIHLKVWQVFILDFAMLLISIKIYLQKRHPFSAHQFLTQSGEK